jgi:hypothetical protein
MSPAGVLETGKATHALKDLFQFGPGVWLDYVPRDLIASGELQPWLSKAGCGA